MKTISRLILIQIIVVISMLGVAKDYLALATDNTVSITASGTKPLTPGELLDDFRYAAPLNVWGARAGAFKSSTDANCTASYTNDPAIVYGGSGYSLKLDYNVGATNTYTGYYSSMGGGSLTGYTALSFYVKGAAGGEFFKIQFKSNNTYRYWDAAAGTHYYRNMASVYITDYLDGGVTTSWQKVTIPFDNFANLNGWDSMAEFVIVFENAQSVINESPTQGTVYIDNIRFETSAISAVRVDHFGDKLGVCALGGNMGTTTGNDGTISYGFSNGADEYYPSAYGLRLDYNVTSKYNAWAGVYLIFGGGNDTYDETIMPKVEDPSKMGWMAVPHDFSAYNYLYIIVRGKSSTENPKDMKIELVDSSGKKFARISGITAGFQAYKIPLSGFVVDPNTDPTPLNKAAIKQLNFVFEGQRINTTEGSKAGVVYIDSVEFRK